jgi:adenylate cyclase
VQAETARIADEHPDWPRFRIAVNSGEALVGVVGAESGRSYTVIGDTVNVAARLESRAPVGGVVVGGATLRGVPGLRATSLGEVEVRGKREGVDAYLLDTRLS